MNGYTGRLLEDEVLGKCLWHSAGYVPYREAMDRVKQFQPWNPADPPSRALNDLHALVCEELGARAYSEVKCYTAVGSPLDRFHGVDSFIEKGGAVATIDLTANSKKDVHKADIILHEEDVYDGEGRINRPRLQQVAHNIAQLLQYRQPEMVAVR
jgi:hypothetical protein